MALVLALPMEALPQDKREARRIRSQARPHSQQEADWYRGLVARAIHIQEELPARLVGYQALVQDNSPTEAAQVESVLLQRQHQFHYDRSGRSDLALARNEGKPYRCIRRAEDHNADSACRHFTLYYIYRHSQ